ncbi:glycosyltransferase family 4 protein [Aquicella lusitana]|uniref:Glycosyltransferase involved in cell wall biosynthesis n=1 Tax=Aquicella lusitana TaxID=254246 RepID=A0A370GP61_9COXI|nr:glycosyltransferase family 4 protein [Aquicella lusitana]RDI45139.1 glycosyltransferase involved in cell wall biosynthesis [Aquicella lusitana]VVC72791.1 Alpha-D-kanosaminyltransferase [Aquicella lusitana]
MRILLITHTHSPSGGAENYFFDLKKRLKKVPSMEVYSLGFGPAAEEGEDFFVLKASGSNLSKLLWRLLFHPLIYLRLRHKIKKIRPDVIHIHNIKHYSVSLLRAIKPYPVIHTVHDYSLLCPTGQNIHRDLTPCPSGFSLKCFWQHRVKYRRLTYLILTLTLYLFRHRLKKIVKQFIAPSPLLVDYLKRNQFQDSIYIPPFMPEKKPLSFEKVNPHLFLFAGNLGAHKGITLLLEEFARACQHHPQLQLMIAGTGPDENRMRKKLHALGIERQVTFLGWQADLSTYYKTCTAVIFPSVGLESFGLVITESMSHGRAVIGVNRGTVPWLVDNNRTGLLFNPVKKGDLAEKILMLAQNSELAKQLGKQGHEKLQSEFDNEAILHQLLMVYQNIC